MEELAVRLGSFIKEYEDEIAGIDELIQSGRCDPRTIDVLIARREDKQRALFILNLIEGK